MSSLCYSRRCSSDVLHLFYFPSKTFQPLFFSLPWNQSTPLGFFFEICYSVYAVEIYLFVTGTYLVLYISFCFHNQAFFKMFQHSLSTFDDTDKVRELKLFLRQLIIFHNSVKLWFKETTNIFSPFIMGTLICNMIILSCVIFELDMVCTFNLFIFRLSVLFFNF